MAKPFENRVEFPDQIAAFAPAFGPDILVEAVRADQMPDLVRRNVFLKHFHALVEKKFPYLFVHGVFFLPGRHLVR